jgi:ATP-dependent DNA helicase RecQ
VLLGYFGERAGPCGNCDVCLDPSTRIDGTADARKIFEVIVATGGRYGAGHLVDVLRGTANEKTERWNHTKLASFGIGAERKREDWQSLIRQLVAGGFLTVDMQGYGALTISDKGRALLRGKETFTYRPPVAHKRAERKQKSAEAAATLDDGDTSLLSSLKQLRMRLAKARQVPAYLIFSDRTLIDMAQKKPATVEEFGEVNGVGAAKQKEFAAIFLEAIRTHAE